MYTIILNKEKAIKSTNSGKHMQTKKLYQAKNREMAIQNANEIHLNGRLLVKGDEGSIRVIFNNLSGKNFENQPAWKTQTHSEYLSMMAAEWGVTFVDGFIELLNSDKVTLNSHQF